MAAKFRRCLVMAIASSALAIGSVRAQETPAPHGPEGAAAAPHAPGGHGDHIGAAGVSTDPSEFKSDLAIYTVVVFLLLLGILRAFAWKPIAGGLETREAGIRKNIADAEAARIKAEQMLAEHAAKLERVQDEVKEIIAEARRDAETARQNILAVATRDAEATRDRAIDDINRARDQALKDLFDTMADQVVGATEHVLGRSVSEGDQDRLINEALTLFRERRHG